MLYPAELRARVGAEMLAIRTPAFPGNRRPTFCERRFSRGLALTLDPISGMTWRILFQRW